MATTTPFAQVEALTDAIRAVLEQAETTRLIDDPGPHLPEFDFDPAYYVEVGIVRLCDPTRRPTDGTLPLQGEIRQLIADLRLVLQRRKIPAGACKAFVPAEPRADDEVRVYFKLGAYVFLVQATPEPDPPAWRMQLLINVDPDAIEDDGL